MKKYVITYKQTITPVYVTDDPHGPYPSPPPYGTYVGFEKHYDPPTKTMEVRAISKDTAKAIFSVKISERFMGSGIYYGDYVIDAVRNIVSIDELRL